MGWKKHVYNYRFPLLVAVGKTKDSTPLKTNMTLKNQHFPIWSTSSNGGSPPKITKISKNAACLIFFPHKNGCVILMIPVTCCRKGSGGGFCFPTISPVWTYQGVPKTFGHGGLALFSVAEPGKKKHSGAPRRSLGLLRQVGGGIWSFVFGVCLFFQMDRIWPNYDISPT